jgi:protein N-terminal methyltransferase
MLPRLRQEEVAAIVTDRLPVYGGVDSNDATYASIRSLWSLKTGGAASSSAHATSASSSSSSSSSTGAAATTASWYRDGKTYWDAAPKDLEGVLGGCGYISGSDISWSSAFLRRIQRRHGVGSGRCLDVGAGIGRVTRGLLMPAMDVCDLVEQSPGMLAVGADMMRLTSGTYPGGDTPSRAAVLLAERGGPPIPAGKGALGTLHVAGIQDFDFNATGVQYDVVWLQWVVGCVTDADLVWFLASASRSLAPRGCIVIKDNVCRPGQGFWYDESDGSIARGREYFSELFALAGVDVVEEVHQDGSRAKGRKGTGAAGSTGNDEALEELGDGWDPDLMPIATYMLRPRPGDPARPPPYLAVLEALRAQRGADWLAALTAEQVERETRERRLAAQAFLHRVLPSPTTSTSSPKEEATAAALSSSIIDLS